MNGVEPHAGPGIGEAAIFLGLFAGGDWLERAPEKFSILQRQKTPLERIGAQPRLRGLERSVRGKSLIAARKPLAPIGKIDLLVPRPEAGFRKGFFFGDKGIFRWGRTEEAVQSRIRQRAYRAFRGDVYKAATAGYEQGGWKAAEAAVKAEMRGAGMSSSRWAMAKMAGGSVARVGMSAFNAWFAADLIVGVGGAVTNALIELGKPKDVTPRFYDNPYNATMRQAGLMAISTNQLGSRNAFGREASYLHNM